MPSIRINYYRRRDRAMAESVQSGLFVLYSAGVAEACQYMARMGVSDDVIARVACARYVRGAGVPVRIACSRSPLEVLRRPVAESP
jgi:hypothetical protein